MDVGTLLMLFRREAEQALTARRAGQPFDPAKGQALVTRIVASFEAAGLGREAAAAAVREVCMEVAR